MSTVKKPSGRKRGEVTADDPVAAAIDIVDREGVDALTIRRVAEACGLSSLAAAPRSRGSRRSDGLDHPAT
jgi:DNA-binding transcriptional regulator YbjK